MEINIAYGFWVCLRCASTFDQLLHCQVPKAKIRTLGIPVVAECGAFQKKSHVSVELG